jgi:hypothetical protein
MKYGKGRPPGKKKGSRPTWAQPSRYPVTVRHVEPSPAMAPEIAARVRAKLARLDPSGWELQRLDRRYSGDSRRVPLA